VIKQLRLLSLYKTQ